MANNHSTNNDLEARKKRVYKKRRKKYRIFLKRVSLISIFFLSITLLILSYDSLSNVVSAVSNEITENLNTTSIPSEQKEDDSLPLSNKVIVLDAGHDQYTNEYEGYIEGIAMFSLAEQIKPLLENQGATVYLTREDGNYVELWERVAITNILSLEKLREIKINEGYSENDEIFTEIEYLISILQTFDGANQDYVSQYLNTPFDEENTISSIMQRVFTLQSDKALQDSFLFISLHSDGLEQSYYDYVAGADVYYISNGMPDDFGDYYTQYSSIDNNIKFADILLDDINAIGMPRSDILEGNFHVLREVNIPAVLVENGYHTNDEDRAMLEDPAFITNLANAYSLAISEYFNSL